VPSAAPQRRAKKTRQKEPRGTQEGSREREQKNNEKIDGMNYYSFM
jgi:hypothetical protein